MVIALGGVVSSLAAVVFRLQEQRAKKAEEGETYWRDMALTNMGLAKMAADEAEKRKR